MSLKEIIAARIKARGPLTVADYMEFCLAHPEHGYYKTREPFGVDGDFITAPEISQIFGEMIGAWIAHVWQAAGGGEAVLVELGPGRGTLMKDVLRATRHVSGFHDAIEIVMVETSPGLQDIQKKNLANVHPHIRWQEDIGNLPAKPLLLVANELFDALPIHQFIYKNNQWNERRITLDEQQNFTWMESPPEKISAPANAGAQDGDIAETCPMAESILAPLAAHIARHGGAGMIIDYGYASGHGDTLQAMKRHHYVSVFDSPGESDITAYVDFANLKKIAENHTMKTYLADQGDFLRRCGAELRATALSKDQPPAQQAAILQGLERLVSPARMGTLFKCLAILPANAPIPPSF